MYHHSLLLKDVGDSHKPSHLSTHHHHFRPVSVEYAFLPPLTRTFTSTSESFVCLDMPTLCQRHISKKALAHPLHVWETIQEAKLQNK